jgi:hypothetical protein
MKTHVLLGVIIVTLVSAPAFSQAAAESALTHSMSTTSTINAASVLNRSTKQATGQLQDRLSRSVQLGPQHNDQVLQKNQVPGRTAVKPGVPSHPGKFAICVQGSATTCSPGTKESSPESPQSSSPAKSLPGKPAQDKYKAEVTISFPK